MELNQTELNQTDTDESLTELTIDELGQIAGGFTLTEHYYPGGKL